ncbi:murein hydrolase activator EnvC family protein [Tenacibaculum piscium]|uniref:murein hydrolase activator EnvC family protein n=1 Tax=Tenacibaculum piscium TaxID=1458515 RepID=UPI001F184EC5|nr:peptidoglycan DD-metalloendopeptidase family protein [Tenacibaculum piscium]
MKNIAVYLCFFYYFFTSFNAFSQEIKSLEEKHQKLKNEIKQINNLLFETKKEKGNALEDLKDLTQKIDTRAELIEIIELEARKISTEITENQQKIKKYKRQLNNLKKEYADMVVKTYKSKSQQSKTMFLLSSKSFHQAYKRLKYMQQYNEYRKKQGKVIIEKTTEIQEINKTLALQKKAKEILISDEKLQKETIETDKENQEILITKIKKEEKKYKTVLLDKIKEEKEITARIDKLIRKAIAKANEKKRAEEKAREKARKKERQLKREKERKIAIEKARKKANEIENEKERAIAIIKAKELAEKKRKEIDKEIANEKAKEKEKQKLIAKEKANNKEPNNTFVLDDDEKELLLEFEQNKGNLPWPVQGIITRKYGVQPHPTFSGININSPGLHIAAKQNADAKSIFNGKILALQTQSAGKKSVLVQHGNYISAYNNLEKVYVKKGDRVKTGDKIGKIFTDKISGKTKLLFVLFKNTDKLNPAKWIRTH